MRIAVAADHGGLPIRDELAEPIRAAGHEVILLDAKIGKAGIDVDALAAQLQTEGAASFDDSFAKLLKSIDSKVASLREA